VGSYAIHQLGSGTIQYIFGSPLCNDHRILNCSGSSKPTTAHISELALALRDVILDEPPDASESIYQVYTVVIWFGFCGKMKDTRSTPDVPGTTIRKRRILSCVAELVLC